MLLRNIKCQRCDEFHTYEIRERTFATPGVGFPRERRYGRPLPWLTSHPIRHAPMGRDPTRDPIVRVAAHCPATGDMYLVSLGRAWLTEHHLDPESVTLEHVLTTTMS